MKKLIIFTYFLLFTFTCTIKSVEIKENNHNITFDSSIETSSASNLNISYDRFKKEDPDKTDLNKNVAFLGIYSSTKGTNSYRGTEIGTVNVNNTDVPTMYRGSANLGENNYIYEANFITNRPVIGIYHYAGWGKINLTRDAVPGYPIVVISKSKNERPDAHLIELIPGKNIFYNNDQKLIVEYIPDNFSIDFEGLTTESRYTEEKNIPTYHTNQDIKMNMKEFNENTGKTSTYTKTYSQAEGTTSNVHNWNGHIDGTSNTSEYIINVEQLNFVVDKQFPLMEDYTYTGLNQKITEPVYIGKNQENKYKFTDSSPGQLHNIHIFFENNYSKNNVNYYSYERNFDAERIPTDIIFSAKTSTAIGNTTFKDEGTYYITVEDLAGNKSYYVVVIDLTPGEIYARYTDEGGSFIPLNDLLNGATHINREIDVIVSDSNKIYPTFFYSKEEWDEYNKQIPRHNRHLYQKVNSALKKEIYYDTYKENGVEKNNSYTTLTAGEYTLFSTDYCGNTSSDITFNIDKTPPTYKIQTVDGFKYSSLAEGEVTSLDVQLLFTTTERNHVTSVKLNGTEILTTSNSYLINTEGSHQIVITDIAGNTSTINFTIDRTAPTFETNLTTEYTNQDVYFNFSSIYTATIKYNNNQAIDYASGTLLTNEGYYIFIIQDVLGNISTKVFTIDKTAPTYNIKGAIIDGITNEDVIISFSTTETKGLAYILVNDKEYPLVNMTTFNENGKYNIKIIDKAGNSVEFTFTIYNTLPIYYTNLPEDVDGTNQDVKFWWDDSSYTAKLNNQPYVKNTVITSPGNYTFTLEDIYGNTSTLRFKIDKTAPTVTFTGLGTNASITNQTVKISWYELGCTATLNGLPILSNYTITNDGEYHFYLIDQYGNIIERSFKVKITKPDVLLTVDDKLHDLVNLNTNGIVKLTWTDEDCIVTINDKIIKGSTTFTEDGVYKVTINDSAHNLITFTFTIDKIALDVTANGNLNNNYYNVDVKVSANNKSEIDYIIINDSKYYEKEILLFEESLYVIQIMDIFGNLSDKTFIEIKKSFNDFYFIELNQDKEIYILYSDLEDNYYNAIELSLQSDLTISINNQVIPPKAYLIHFGIYNIKVNDKYGNTWEKTINVRDINYVESSFNIANPLFGIIIVAIIGTGGFFCYKKLTNKNKNPYLK